MKQCIALVLMGAVLAAGCGAPELETVDRSWMPEDPVRAAAMTGDLDTVKQAVQNDPSWLHATDKSGKTLLHNAAEGSQVEVARFLLENGADPKLPDANGDRPLELAEDEGASQEMIELLKMYMTQGL